MCNRFYSAMLLLWAWPSVAQTFQAVYGFPNVSTSTGTISPGPLPQVGGLACSSFSAYGLASNPNASGRFSFTGWPVGAADTQDDYSTYTSSPSPFSYYEVALTPAVGHTLSLTGVDFSVRRSGTGIRNYSVRSSIDGFNTNLTASTGTNTNLQVLPDDVFFWKYDNTSTSSDQRGSVVAFGASHSSIVSTVFLRFYAWNSEAVNGTFSIDDVRINGSLVDSALLSGVTVYIEEPVRVWFTPGYIVHDGRLVFLELYSADGTVIGCWNDPPSVVPVPGLDPGIYVARFRTDRAQGRQKLLLYR